MNKKIIAAILVILTVFCFVGCGKNDSEENSTGIDKKEDTKDEFNEIWQELSGYWTLDGEYSFVYFGFDEGNKPVFNAAVWMSEIFSDAKVEDFEKTAENEYTFTATFPDEDSEMYETTGKISMSITVDTSVIKYKKINLKSDSGPFYEYRFSGKTVEEASGNLGF